MTYSPSGCGTWRAVFVGILLSLTAIGGMCQSSGDPLSSTKSDPVAKPLTSDGALPGLGQMLGAVLVVGAIIKWGLPKWFKPRLGGARTNSDGTLRVIETVSGATGTFQIVEAMGRRFLVAANGTAPVSTWNASAANAHTSVRASTSSPRSCSGGM